jgi:hypothetical protein
MLGYGESVGRACEQAQCRQTTEPSAQQYAFDASNRIFEKQQNAIENEIIRAREDGQREGREQEYQVLQAERKQWQLMIESMQQQILLLRAMTPLIIYPCPDPAVEEENKQLQFTVDSLQLRNDIQYRMITDLQERNDWQARTLETNASALLKLQQEFDAYRILAQTTVGNFLRGY